MGGDVEFFNSQKELYPTHVPLYHARLQHVVKNAKAGNPVNGEELDSLVKSILDNVDLKEVIFALNKKNISSPEEKKFKMIIKNSKMLISPPRPPKSEL